MTEIPPEVMNWFFGLFFANIASIFVGYVKIAERLATLEANMKALMVNFPKRKED